MVPGEKRRRALLRDAGCGMGSGGDLPLPPSTPCLPTGDMKEVARMSPGLFAGVPASGPVCLPVFASLALGRTTSALEPGLRYPPLGPVPRECLIHNPARSRKPSSVTLTSLHR